MKKICVFITVVMLGYTANAQITKQAKPVNRAVRPNSATARAGKTEYVDFNIKTESNGVSASRYTFMMQLVDSFRNKKLVGYDTQISYDATDNNFFSKPLKYGLMAKRLEDKVVIEDVDKEGKKVKRVMTNDFTPEQIMGYRLKQQVIVDNQTGATQTIPVGIALTAVLKLSNGDTISGFHPVCWFKYSQCKALLVGKPATKKLAAGAWDALFLGGKEKTL